MMAKKDWKAIQYDWDALDDFEDTIDIHVCLTQRQVAILKASLIPAYWTTRWENLGISAGELHEDMSAIDAALDEVCGGGVAFEDVRQKDDCTLEKKISGVWSDFADISLCVVSEDGGSDYYNQLNINLIQQNLFLTMYDGTPTSINVDAPDVTFTSDQSGDDSADMQTALCMAAQAFVGSFCARKVQELDRKYLGVFLILAGIAVLTGGLGLLAGIAVGGAGLIGSWSYSDARAALLDIGAQAEVACCLLDGLSTSGSDLVTNGDFSAWTAGFPDSWDNNHNGTTRLVKQVGAGEDSTGSGTGAVNMRSNSGANLRVRQAITMPAGNYLLRLDNTVFANELIIQEYSGGTTYGTLPNTGENLRLQFASLANAGIRLGSHAPPDTENTADNVELFLAVDVGETEFSDALDNCTYTPDSNEDIVSNYVADSMQSQVSYLAFLDAVGRAYYQVTVFGDNACDCGDWTHVFDFTVDAQGWTELGVGGWYDAGVGWKAEIYTGSLYRVAIEITLPDTEISRIEVYGTLPGNQTYGNEVTLRVLGINTYVDNQTVTPDAFDDWYLDRTISGNKRADNIVVAYPDSDTAYYYTKIIVHGKGTDPF